MFDETDVLPDFNPTCHAHCYRQPINKQFAGFMYEFETNINIQKSWLREKSINGTQIKKQRRTD